jgi:PAS domain S-box-containing protein
MALAVERFEPSHRRLEHLFEISKVLASFESVAATVPKVIANLGRAIPVHSAILITPSDPAPSVVWRDESVSNSQLECARDRARDTYAYFVPNQPAGDSLWEPAEDDDGHAFILLPLAVSRRRVLGALQVETTPLLDETDLGFINSVVNQLAVALERQAQFAAQVAAAEAGRAAAEAQRERFGKLLDHLDDAFVWEAEHNLDRLTYVSARSEAVLGFSRERLLETRGLWRSCIHPDDLAMFIAACERALREGRDQRCEHRAFAADGRLLWLHTGIHPTGWHASGPLQAVSFDITAAKQAAETIRLQLEAITRVERAQGFLADVGNVLGSSLDDRDIVAAVLRLAIPSEGDLCRIDVRTPQGVARQGAAIIDQGQLRVYGKGRRVWSIESTPETPLAQVFRSGRAVIAEELSAEVVDVIADDEIEAQRVRGMKSMLVAPLAASDGVFGTITFAAGRPNRYAEPDLQLAEELARRLAVALENARLYHRAEEAVRVRNHLLAVVCHDLRTPLATILLHADVMLRGLNDGKPDNHAHIASILRTAKGMRRLIGDLTDAGSIRAGRFSSILKPESATALFADAVELAQASRGSKSLRIESACHDCDGVTVACDRDRLNQVFSNLVSNAVKFTPEGGTITLQAGRRDDEICFSIADTGPGIPPEYTSKVFDRFWQAEETSHLGSGLGLAIAKGIIDAHGGKIWVTSRVGTGSIFSFSLPLAVAS